MAPSPARWLRRHTRGLLWIVGIVAVCALVRGVLPFALEAAGEHFGGEALGRRVAIENIDLALLRGGVRVEGVRVGGPLPPEDFQGELGPIAPADTLFSLGALETELVWGSLIRGVAHLRFLEVERPEAFIAHATDGSFTQIVLALPKPEDPEAADRDADESWPFVLDAFRVREVLLELLYEGESEVRFSLAEFSLADFGFDQGQVSLGAVGIQRPEIRVAREFATGQRPIGAQAARESGAEATAGAPAGAPGHHIREIEIERAEFTLVNDDQPLDVVLALSARDLRIDPGTTFPFEIHLEIAGGRFDVEGDLGVSPPRFDGKVQWADIGFPVLVRSLGVELPIETESVRSNADLEISALVGQNDQEGRLDIAGEFVANDLVTQVKATGERLSVARLAVQSESFSMALVPGGGAAGSAAAFRGSAESDGVRFEAPDGSIALAIAEVRARQLDAALPLHPATPLRLRGDVDVSGVKASTDAGQEIAIGGVKLALAEFGLAPDTPIGIEAGLALDAIRFSDTTQDIQGEVAGLHVAGLEAQVPQASGVDSGGLTLKTSSVRVDRPILQVVRAAPGGATSAAKEDAGQTAFDASSAAGTPEPTAHLVQVEVRGGAVTVTDRSVEPFARSRVDNITLDAREIRWPEQQVGQFSLRSEGPAGATFEAQGRLGRSGQIDWSLASLGLPHFNPYAKPVGYRVAEGAFAIDGEVALEGEVVAVDSQLVLDQLDLEAHRSEEFQDQIGVPLDLAIGLLKDPFGRISLPVRFEAERDEVRAQLVPLVLSTLRHAVVGAVTLPLKALKGLVNTDGGADLSLPVVASAPGSAELAPESLEGIQALAQLLAERPQLGLVVEGRTASVDEEPLALAVLAEATQAEVPFPESVEVGLFARRRLRSALRDHGVDAAAQLDAEDQVLLKALVAATPVTEARKTALADARAAAVRSALVDTHGVAGERLRLRSAVNAGAPGTAPELVAMGSLAAVGEDGASSLPSVSSDGKTP